MKYTLIFILFVCASYTAYPFTDIIRDEVPYFKSIVCVKDSIFCQQWSRYFLITADSSKITVDPIWVIHKNSKKIVIEYSNIKDFYSKNNRTIITTKDGNKFKFIFLDLKGGLLHFNNKLKKDFVEYLKQRVKKIQN